MYIQSCIYYQNAIKVVSKNILHVSGRVPQPNVFIIWCNTMEYSIIGKRYMSYNIHVQLTGNIEYVYTCNTDTCTWETVTLIVIVRTKFP